MTCILNAVVSFTDTETFRENEVRLDELVRDFVSTVQSEFGDQLTTASLSGQYIGTQHYVGPDASSAPPEAPASPNSDFLDESVVDDGDGDSGLDGGGGGDGDVHAPDADGPHPGDVLDPANSDLAMNRSVPGEELRPNPEDTLGHGEGYQRDTEEEE